jgi:hypothetical protein
MGLLWWNTHLFSFPGISLGIVTIIVIIILTVAMYIVKVIIVDRNSISSLVTRFLSKKDSNKSEEMRSRHLPTFAGLVGQHFVARGAFSGAILGLAAWAISRTDPLFADRQNEAAFFFWTPAILAFLSLAAFIDAALIARRLRGGQYGLSALEVKEIGSFVIDRRENGRGPGEFSGVFAREGAEGTSAEVGGAVVGAPR